MIWNKVKLGTLITESKLLSEKPNPNKRIRVKLNVAGVEKRPLENEIEGATKQFVRKAGQFIYGKQNFHKGAFGVIPKELDGYESSADIPCFDVTDNCLPGWIHYYFKQGNYYKELEKLARGVGSKRIHPEQIYELEIPLPDIVEQKKILKTYQNQESEFQQLASELTTQQTLLKKLRQQILQDAVQGKLVPQDAKDEPASALLKRIKEKKQKLIAKGKLRQDKPLPPIKVEDVPFQLPKNWMWCRLGEIIEDASTGPFGTMLHKSDYIYDGIPLVNPMNIVEGKIIPSPKMTINEKTLKRLINYQIKKGDVIIARRGEMGRCAIVTDNENGWLCGTGSFFIRLYPKMNRKYFAQVFRSAYAVEYLTGSSVGSTMNNLNHRILLNLPFPFPPHVEQERIVSKVEQLLQQCKELEKNIEQNKKYAEQLQQAVLQEAFKPKVEYKTPEPEYKMVAEKSIN